MDASHGTATRVQARGAARKGRGEPGAGPRLGYGFGPGKPLFAWFISRTRTFATRQPPPFPEITFPVGENRLCTSWARRARAEGVAGAKRVGLSPSRFLPHGSYFVGGPLARLSGPTV